MMFGLIQEAKSWDEFEAKMKADGGSFALVLVVPADPINNKGALDDYCTTEFPQFKCFYGVEDSPPHSTSFDKHFHNDFDGAIAFFKDGVQKAWVSPSGIGKKVTQAEIRDGFNKAK